MDIILNGITAAWYVASDVMHTSRGIWLSLRPLTNRQRKL